MFIKDSLINYAPKPQENEEELYCMNTMASQSIIKKTMKGGETHPVANCSKEEDKFIEETREMEKVKTLIDPEKSLVRQLKKIHKNLAKNLKKTGEFLSCEFSSLVTYPELEPLIQTFIRFHQVPPDDLDYNL